MEIAGSAFSKAHDGAPEGFPSVDALRAEATRLHEKLVEHLDATASVIQEFDDIRGRMLVDFEHDAVIFEKIHAQALDAQQSHKQLIDENQRISRELVAAREEEEKAKKAEDENRRASAVFGDARSTLSGYVNDRRRVLRDAAEKVAGNSSEALVAKIKRDPCPEERVNAVRNILEGSYISDPEERAREWVSAIAHEGWPDVCNRILGIYESKVMAGSPPEPSEKLIEDIASLLLGEAQISTRAAKKIYANLNDTTVGAILSAAPRDYIALTYVDENGKRYEFKRASPGQQASALLELLLRQQAGTLIIDQPEDDLDNKVIMRIVELIKKSKSTRQLIFATHNPNIVVNGDADKIINLSTGDIDPNPNNDEVRIAVDEDGAIETPAMCKIITEIMEGGAGAFDLRRRKYRFDKPA